MQLREFQTKELLSRYSIAVPEGLLAATAGEAELAAMRLRPGSVFVKAQILAGDRAAAGGIRPASSAVLAKTAATGIAWPQACDIADRSRRRDDKTRAGRTQH